jgi:hypothetical protein
MSRKEEVISLLSEDSSINPVDDAKVTDVNVDIPVNAPIETIANFWSDVTDNFLAKNNITLPFTIRGAPIALP